MKNVHFFFLVNKVRHKVPIITRNKRVKMFMCENRKHLFGKLFRKIDEMLKKA